MSQISRINEYENGINYAYCESINVALYVSVVFHSNPSVRTISEPTFSRIYHIMIYCALAIDVDVTWKGQ